MSNDKKMGGRDIKRRILGLLETSDFKRSLDELLSLQPKKSVNALISFLCHNDLKIHHRAGHAIGHVVSRIASQDRERARIILRRLMWMLNDESGGIGWGVPEAMAEIMVHDDGLADEYGHMLVSYLDEDGNFLEYEPLQRGLIWAIGRVAETRPELVVGAAAHLPKYLASEDAAIRGLAAMVIGILKVEAARDLLKTLVDDMATFTVYVDDQLVTRHVGDLVSEGLAKFS